MERSQQIVLAYLLTSKEGEIVKQSGRKLKKLQGGDKTRPTILIGTNPSHRDLKTNSTK